MKHLTLFLFLLSVSLTACTFTLPSGTTSGNGATTPSNNGAGLEQKQRTTTSDKLATELGLSAQQRSQYDAIMADHQQKVAAIQADKSLNDTSRKVKLNQQKSKMQDAVRAILTPQQAQKYNQMIQDSENRDPVVIPGRN